MKQAISPLLLLIFTLALQAQVVEVTSSSQYNSLREGNKLLVIDLTASWCRPCLILSPLLSELATENASRATFLKVDIDQQPSIAQSFRYEGVPYVAFMRNKKVLFALTGLREKAEYQKAIEIFSGNISDKADGALLQGVRKIGISPQDPGDNVHVFVGEKVEISISKAVKGTTLSVPAFGVKRTTDGLTPLKATFTATTQGAYELDIQSATGGTTRHWLLVSPKEQAGSLAQMINLTATEMATKMKKLPGLLLDVRTPEEYAAEALPDATLIPVQELATRTNEIASYKRQAVYIYCRSGNRSATAAKILLDAGFSEVYNLTGGIGAWKKAGLPLRN